jgi:hypothetical protein
MFRTSQNTVACRPFPEKIQKTEKKTGLAFGNLTTALVELEVVAECYGPTGLSSNLRVNDHVFVRPDRSIQPWAKEICKAPGIEGDFILVPINEVLLHRSREELPELRKAEEK